MICVKCGQRFSPHMSLDDPRKCDDCQPRPNSPDIEPEAEVLGVTYESEYDLGGEA